MEFLSGGVNGAFSEALEQRIIAENPTKTLMLPHTRERDTHTIPFEDVQRLEDGLEGRDKVIFRLPSRCGPRAGEAFAFQWQDLQPDQTLRIQRTYSRGELKPPKTKKSRKPIYLPLSLYSDLQQLKEVSKDFSPTGWIFPSERKRRRRLENRELEASATMMPLDYHNWVVPRRFNQRRTTAVCSETLHCDIAAISGLTPVWDAPGRPKPSIKSIG